MWKTWAWWKNFNLTRKGKALILNKYIKVNVRHRAFKFWLAQTSGFVLLATVAILNLTTQKNHPVPLPFSSIAAICPRSMAAAAAMYYDFFDWRWIWTKPLWTWSFCFKWTPSMVTGKDKWVFAFWSSNHLGTVTIINYPDNCIFLSQPQPQKRWSKC